MNISKDILSYIPKGYGDVVLQEGRNAVTVHVRYEYGTEVQDKIIGRITKEDGFIPNSDSIRMFNFEGRRKLVTGPYEIMDVVSKPIDASLDARFRDKAIYIKAIAKVRAATDVDVKELEDVLLSSAFSPLFESFDFEGFFSSLDRDGIQCFLQEHSATACSFISEIGNADMRNRAIVDVRSKLNSLVSSSREEGNDQIWSFFNLLSIIYYSDIIKFLLSKMAYSTCYACQLFNMASNLVYFDDGINGGKDISLGSLKEKKFLEDLNVLRTKYA